MFERLLIISDMDGTLLNHHNYRVEAALPLLKQLEEAFIPVIFNTSKTFAELKDWVSLLKNKHPFIVENGSAIYIPENYFTDLLLSKHASIVKSVPGYKVIVTGIEIKLISDYVKKMAPDAIDLTLCSLQQAMEITGLTEVDAKAAQTRQYSVPLMFKDPLKQQTFAEQAQQEGFGILKGGRFLHILGCCDKGQAMQALKKIYEFHYLNTFRLIVLGDSQNDLAMLEQADYPIIVKSPSSHSVELPQQKVTYTHSEAPEGWVEGIKSVLVEIGFNLKQER